MNGIGWHQESNNQCFHLNSLVAKGNLYKGIAKSFNVEGACKNIWYSLVFVF